MVTVWRRLAGQLLLERSPQRVVADRAARHQHDADGQQDDQQDDSREQLADHPDTIRQKSSIGTGLARRTA